VARDAETLQFDMGHGYRKCMAEPVTQMVVLIPVPPAAVSFLAEVWMTGNQVLRWFEVLQQLGGDRVRVMPPTPG
jgi:hypothetical protein